MLYAEPNTKDALLNFKSHYDNYIGGEWVSASDGSCIHNISPVTGSVFCTVSSSTIEDVDRAVISAQKAFVQWSKTAVQERSNILLKIADRIEKNLQVLALAETWDNGKPIRETLNADIPLMVDHFRYFAGCLRAQEGTATDIDQNTSIVHIKEPIGVVAQIIPWNFPLLMAAWKLAPALAAGCCVVLKPAEQTPASIMVLMEIIGDLLPPGVINVVNGLGQTTGAALASHPNISKVAFTGSTEVGIKILHNAAEQLIPSTVELGGKSPNIYFSDILQQETDYIDKCVEGLLMGYFNQGEVCTCPSRVLIQEDIFSDFIQRVIEQGKKIKQGSPLDTETQVGAQVSREQFERIMDYIRIGTQEGAKVLLGGKAKSEDNGYYIQPTLLHGNNSMRIFQEEIFGPVIGVTSFKDTKHALTIANDTDYGLGAGIWTRDSNIIHTMSRGIQAGRIWVNCYHAYPAHAAFGGYKKSGIGRETHKVALDNYQQTKSIISSYSTKKIGFF